MQRHTTESRTSAVILCLVMLHWKLKDGSGVTEGKVLLCDDGDGRCCSGGVE